MKYKQRSKVVDLSIVSFCLNVEYEKPKTKNLILLPSQWYHLSMTPQVFIPFFLTYFSMPYNYALQLCWGISIYSLLLSQIGMNRPACDLTEILNPGTTHIFGFS